MSVTPWPVRRELAALCRLLCRPSPPLVGASRLHAASCLHELQRHLGVAGVTCEQVAALQSKLEAWRRDTCGGLVSFYDSAYPDLLRQIARPPVALFVVGEPRWLREAVVAVVGTRAASDVAKAWTRELAFDLARCGVVVASGLARGIDAAAHTGAVLAGGPTVAVLGCGPDVCYPPEHAELARRIGACGCLVSELPPGTPPLPWHFPLRNRILSGLAVGVVVVQAEPKSGALITARQALEENRHVMAVPGDVGDPRSRGPHQLLREGATLVDGARDVLEALGWLTLAPMSAAAPAWGALEGPERAARGALLAALGPGLQIEALRERLGWSAEQLQRMLAELELAGVLVRGSAGMVLRAPATGP